MKIRNCYVQQYELRSYLFNVKNLWKNKLESKHHIIQQLISYPKNGNSPLL